MTRELNDGKRRPRLSLIFLLGHRLVIFGYFLVKNERTRGRQGRLVEFDFSAAQVIEVYRGDRYDEVPRARHRDKGKETKG